jgi:hypothetical protein
MPRSCNRVADKRIESVSYEPSSRNVAHAGMCDQFCLTLLRQSRLALPSDVSQFSSSSQSSKKKLACTGVQATEQANQTACSIQFFVGQGEKRFLERTKQARSARHGVHVYRWRRHVVRRQHGNVGQRAQGCDKAWSKLAFFFPNKNKQGWDRWSTWWVKYKGTDIINAIVAMPC